MEFSPRQQQLIQLIDNGLSNKEIGRILGLTEGTIKQYIHRLISKLGTRHGPKNSRVIISRFNRVQDMPKYNMGSE